MGALLSNVSEPFRRWPRRQTNQPPSPADPPEPDLPPTPSLREATERSGRQTGTSSPSSLDRPSPKSNPTGSDSGAPVSQARSGEHSLRFLLLGPEISVFGSDVQLPLPTGPDVKQFESSGRATEWAETMPIRPPAGECKSTACRSSSEAYPKVGAQDVV